MRGMGVEVVSIARVDRDAPALDAPFVMRTFTARERAEAASRACPKEYLAGRLAAKGAVLKAVSGVAVEPTDRSRIEVLADDAGCPRVTTRFAGVESVLVSISHDGGLACAFAIAQ